MADPGKRLFYIIRWMKYQNPSFQFAEMIPTQGGRYVPKPPMVYSSLSIIFMTLKRNYSGDAAVILTLGLTEEEKREVTRLMAGMSRVELLRHLPRPIGKKADGTPYRVFMVDADFENLKAIKQEIAREHFEILGLARNADAALDFFLSNRAHIDVVILSLGLPENGSLFVMDKMLSAKVGIRIFGLAPKGMPIAPDRLAQLAGREAIPIPLDREALMRVMGKALSG
ncbi:MAG: hypothetical protein J0L75_18640 [Spirochaetes bacterium]|nr:hypothetical protein [Spirochaetota bacterium]